MTLSRIVTLLAVLILDGPFVAASQHQPRPQDDRVSYSLHEGVHHVWLIEHRAGPDGITEFRFACAALDGPRAFAFRLHSLIPVRGRITAVQVRGSTLHMFFADGTHRSLRRLPDSAAEATGEPPSPEPNLPSRPSPNLVAVDHGTAVLYALVQASVADAIREERLRDAAAGQPAEDTPTDPGKPEASRATRTGASGSTWRLVRYDDGRWEVDRELPTEFPDAPVGLAAAHGEVTLLYRRFVAEPLYVMATSASPSEDWIPQDFEGLHGTPAHLRMFENETLALAIEGSAANAPVSVLRHLKDGFAAPVQLRLQDRGSSTIRSPGALRLLSPREGIGILTDAQATPTLVRWNLQTGELTGTPALEAVFARAQTVLMRRWISHIVNWVLAPVVLIIILLRRRDTVLFPAVLAPGQRLAPLVLRGVAFILDTVLLFPAGFGLSLALLSGYSQTLDPLDALESIRIGQSFSPAVFWSLGVAAAIQAIYGCLAEGITGTTIGKKLLGLRVQRLDGGRCGLLPAAGRNLLRIIDAYFPPGLLLVVMTLNRQRVGDVVARTIVVAGTAGSADEPLDATPAGRNPSESESAGPRT